MNPLVVAVIYALLFFTNGSKMCYEYKWDSEGPYHGCHSSEPICNAITASRISRCDKPVKCDCGGKCKEFWTSVNTKDIGTGNCIKDEKAKQDWIKWETKGKRCVTPKQEQELCNKFKQKWASKIDKNNYKKGKQVKDIECGFKN